MIEDTIDENLKKLLSWSIVNEKNGCWEYQGALSKGYGLIRIEGKMCRAHRLAWTLMVGPIPEKIIVCHKCDNPKCINPRHLFLGTNKDNTKDMIEKGRKNTPTGDNHWTSKKPQLVPCGHTHWASIKVGEKSPSSKITDHQCSLLRNDREIEKLSYEQLGKKYGIGKSQAWNICHHTGRKVL